MVLEISGYGDTDGAETLGISVGRRKSKYANPPRKPLPPGTIDDTGKFASSIHPSFLDQIHKRESRARNYQDINRDNSGEPVAVGRYQFTKPALRAVGLLDKKGNWTGKYGIGNINDFLGSAETQERAMVDLLRDNWSQLQSYGATDHIGRYIDGIRGKFRITESGLYAASHRRGAEAINDYLRLQKANGWDSRKYIGHPKETIFRQIETRLREFQTIPVRRKQ